jgi:hypothetical protein
MQQTESIRKSTNVRRLGEKVTHRYHSVDELNFFSLPKVVTGAKDCLADGQGEGTEGLA